MNTIETKMLADELTKYIKEKHTQEDCLGFSDGFELALKLAKNNEVLDPVSKSVFIVCENDDYGRNLYLDTKNTKKEAEDLKGRITSRNIYEHEID